MGKRVVLCILVFAFALESVFSLPLESVVAPSLAAQLRESSELITETQLRNPVPRLIPQNAELRSFINAARSTLAPTTMVEALHLYRKPASFHTSPDNWNEAQKIGVFNQITAISSLAGIQYFSSSRGTMRTFYESSAVIDAPNTRNVLPDPVFARPPESLTLHARQKDLTFGENIYRYDYVSSGDVVYFTQENVTALNIGLIHAIGRGNLKSIIAIIDCGDSILIYVVSMAKASSVPGLGDRIGNSFGNRARAVLDWLSGRLNSRVYN
ncbi:MAG: hypothetical protein FWC01_02040 [Treponema sp.]|nr:hypothetical protein [Treponema sp.]MCL2237079.1 hypothetical protein [Treponema sp.]